MIEFKSIWKFGTQAPDVSDIIMGGLSIDEVGNIYTRDTTKTNKVSSKLYSQNTKPTDASVGDRWFKPETKITYQRVSINNTSYWYATNNLTGYINTSDDIYDSTSDVGSYTDFLTSFNLSEQN